MAKRAATNTPPATKIPPAKIRPLILWPGLCLLLGLGFGLGFGITSKNWHATEPAASPAIPPATTIALSTPTTPPFPIRRPPDRHGEPTIAPAPLPVAAANKLLETDPTAAPAKEPPVEIPKALPAEAPYGVMSANGGMSSLGPRIGGYRKIFGVRTGNATAASDAAVSSALAWLAKHQEPDGHWSAENNGGRADLHADGTVTGLTLLTFLAAGQTESRGEYKTNVARAVAWIIAHQSASGEIQILNDLTPPPPVVLPDRFTHAICAWALAEAYGMARVSDTGDAARKALAYSVTAAADLPIPSTDAFGTPNPTPFPAHSDGGWSPLPEQPGALDLTVWYAMQIRVARMVGLAVPQERFQQVIVFLDRCELLPPAKNPTESNRFKDAPAALTVTPAATLRGSLIRMFYGWGRENVEPAITWALADQGLPTWGENGAAADWTGWQFGSLAAQQVGGPALTNWNQALRELLLQHQTPVAADPAPAGDLDGSWPACGAEAGFGRAWSTANAALCLQACYRSAPRYDKHNGGN